MLDDLKFVQGAIAKSSYAPELTHFSISGGFVKGYNGELALCSPIAMNLEVTPKAAPFIKAIQTCRETVQLSVTNNGRLAIKSGGFSAYVECAQNEKYPDVEPEGEYLPLTSSIVEVLAKLLPFVANDNSKPWACGVLLYANSAFATNNVILIEHWLPDAFPAAINLPRSAVVEIVRLKEEPIGVQLAPRSITFHYEGGRWLRSQAYDLNWPDVNKVMGTPENAAMIPAGFFDCIKDALPFAGERGCINFNSGVVRTSYADNDGAVVQMPAGSPQVGAYDAKLLLSLREIMQSADWSQYPKATHFFGPGLRGALMGMHDGSR